MFAIILYAPDAKTGFAGRVRENDQTPTHGIFYENIMLVIIAYDICSDRSRARIAKTLMGWGDRVQKSVYECHIDTLSQLNEIKEKIAQHLDIETDTVRYYTLCENDRPDILTDGYQGYHEESDYFLL